ncbi:MAG: hypothetical protein JJU13_07110 [Balneolaceae bacterium]|nr:hypothetical protein [Balneolaceae bacterium]
MASCLIIACDNGFGHTRRALLLANKLANKNWDVYLLAPQIAAQKLIGLFGIEKGVHFEDFNTMTNAEAYREGKLYNWLDDLPKLDEFDVVVSDNLPEILKIRPDTVLSGSFLWHYAVKNADRLLYKKIESLLKEYKPAMIASELLAGPELYKYTNLITVGLFVPDKKKYNTRTGKDLLIACGRGGEYESEFKRLVEKIASQKREPLFHTFWIEPKILPENAPGWMKPATFDEKMYSGLIASICRPGVGTLTDSLWNEAKVFCTFEKQNQEMMQNAKMMKKKNIGNYFRDPMDAYKAASLYVSNLSDQKNFYQSLKKISFNGVEKSIQAIEEYKFGV